MCKLFIKFVQDQIRYVIFVFVNLINFKLISYIVWKEGMIEIMNLKQGGRKVHGLIEGTSVAFTWRDRKITRILSYDIQCLG